MSLVKWRTGKNGQNLPGKVKMAYMGKDHTKVDRNFMLGEMSLVKWPIGKKPFSNGENCESGKKHQ